MYSFCLFCYFCRIFSLSLFLVADNRSDENNDKSVLSSIIAILSTLDQQQKIETNNEVNERKNKRVH